MSLFTKVKMSPGKGQESGQTTEDERERTEPIGSDAKAFRKTDEPKRSGHDPAPGYTPDQTVAESVSQAGSGRLGVETPWTEREQPFSGRREATSFEFVEDQIQRVWSDVGAREVGGTRETQTLG